MPGNDMQWKRREGNGVADGMGTDATGTDDGSAAVFSRRAVLRATGAGASVFAVGTASADGDSGNATTDYCAQTTHDPKMVPYVEGGMEACADDHPVTQRLQEGVAMSLEENFPTVGALIDDGYVPYFDFYSAPEGDDISHWINPEYLGNDAILDPARPESIMVDHHWWRPLGVMFIATRDGEEIDPPPAVYEPETESGDDAAKTADGEGTDPCLPWHTHVGFPGRKSWLKYRAAYDDTWDAIKGGLPCRTPWMLHIWAYEHPEGVYAEGSLPRGSRGGPPAEPAGFQTDAVPGEDDLDRDALLDAANEELHERIDQFEIDLSGIDRTVDRGLDRFF